MPEAAPGDNNTEIFTVPEGKIVSVTSESGGWINIKVKSENENFTGWVENNMVRNINE
ncbi:MAG: SH3 domain-containing protein [Endomicrobium sp.]|jgi:hypothetical protein|nr:SH3 domain-containing protein [Endomicrobium sp.]